MTKSKKGADHHPCTGAETDPQAETEGIREEAHPEAEVTQTSEGVTTLGTGPDLSAESGSGVRTEAGQAEAEVSRTETRAETRETTIVSDVISQATLLMNAEPD